MEERERERESERGRALRSHSYVSNNNVKRPTNIGLKLLTYFNSN